MKQSSDLKSADCKACTLGREAILPLTLIPSTCMGGDFFFFLYTLIEV